MKTVIVVPARLESTRLPRKLLLDRTGKTLIEHTLESAMTSRLADQVIVATDSEEIAHVVLGVGGNAVMTSVTHRCGTDRIAEAIGSCQADIIVNVQGDEPEIDGNSIDLLVQTLLDDANCSVATLATKINSVEQFEDRSCVKVVVDNADNALYFSRSQIPAARDPSQISEWLSSAAGSFLQHVGIYAFRRESLLKFAEMEPSTLERIESLEQLRLLQNGWGIRVKVVDHHAAGIDTAEDYDQFVKRWTNR